MLGPRPMTPEDYLKILRRRIWVIVIPAVVVCAATYLVSLKIPNRYTSQTLVLVEGQRVPDSIVRTMVTGDLNARLASMQEQIMSRTRLQPIVERFGLFSDSRLPMEERVNNLAKAIVVTPVRPMAQTQTNELPGFYISVTLSDARLAQQVCTDVTSMFMDENLRNREERAQSTTDFLVKQLGEAKQKLDEYDSKLAAFKQSHLGEMPEEQQTNLNLLTGLNLQLDAASQSITRAQQDKAFTESLIAEQVADAKQSREGGVSQETLEQQLEQLESGLARLQAQYTNNHPDVIKAKVEIDQMKKRIAASKDISADSASNDKPGQPVAQGQNSETDLAGTESPQLKQLRAQLFATEQTIREKTKQQEELQTRIRTYEGRIRLSPLVEQQLKQLTRDYQTALDFYNDLLKNSNASAMSSDLERRQQGETFQVLDPASLPGTPSYPNRQFIVGSGFGGGLALGLAIVLLLEFRDKSLRDERDIEFFLNLPTLAMLPSIDMNGNGTRRSILRLKKHKPIVRANA
jgi:polysaccharide chain length determinant protein (PEP-CTERM system associated)